MTVRYLEDYKTKHSDSRPRQIFFHSPIYHNENRKESSVDICVRVENGDVAGILKAVMEEGGIGHVREDGTYFFIPWPCAAVEIKDV
jgi:hypothetical protein